jgi:hypothetical protein
MNDAGEEVWPARRGFSCLFLRAVIYFNLNLRLTWEGKPHFRFTLEAYIRGHSLASQI